MIEFSLVVVEEADYVLIQNMIRFYIYDMSEFTGWECPPNGLYGGVDDQPYYFGRIPDDPSDRWPEGWTGKGFKIIVAGEMAGFCLVRFFNDGTTQLNDIGEFFVLRKWRRKGLGKRVAHAVFTKFPGQWHIRQMLDNRPAQSFWRAVITDFTEAGFTERVEFFPEYECNLVVQRFATSD